MSIETSGIGDNEPTGKLVGGSFPIKMETIVEYIIEESGYASCHIPAFGIHYSVSPREDMVEKIEKRGEAMISMWIKHFRGETPTHTIG